MLKSVIEQKPIQIVKKQVDWQKIYKYIDHHHVTSLVYYAVLGTEKEEDNEQDQELYKKFKKALLLKKEYCQAEQTIVWQLEQNHIHALLLSGTKECELYYKEEMGSIDSLEFLIRTPDFDKIHELMESMDYERKEEKGMEGIVYTRTPGIQVHFLSEVPNSDRRIQKLLKKQLRARPYVQALSIEKKYLYDICMLLESYLMGTITIRKVLDFWLYHNRFQEKIDREEIQNVLKKSGMSAWERCLSMLGDLWFGEGCLVEDNESAFALEEYILNPGKVDKRLDRKVLPYGRKRLDFYDRDRDAEWRDKKLTWMFPPKEYMKEMFPILRKFPFPLIIFWAIRGIRIWGKVIKQKAIEIQNRLLHKLRKLKKTKE